MFRGGIDSSCGGKLVVFVLKTTDCAIVSESSRLAVMCVLVVGCIRIGFGDWKLRLLQAGDISFVADIDKPMVRKKFAAEFSADVTMPSNVAINSNREDIDMVNV